MAFDLGDWFNRATEQGEYKKFRHKGSLASNMNPWGKTMNETAVDFNA